MGGLSGIGKVLSQLGRALPLVLPEPQGSPEPLTFENGTLQDATYTGWAMAAMGMGDGGW